MSEHRPFSVEALFATPVIVAYPADSAALNVALEAAILARREIDPGVARTNVGGWHSASDFLDWAGEAGDRIAREVIDFADANTIDTAAPPGVRRGWSVDAWANVIDRRGAHLPHIHPGAYWSAVYYVRVDPGEGGELVLVDPRGAAPQMHAPELRIRGGNGERQVEAAAQAGKLVIFPSWLEHAVRPYSGGGLRISIALNLAARALPVG